MQPDAIGLQGRKETRRDSLDASDLLISYLEQIGVEYLFGIPGGAIEPLYDALARSERRGGARSIVARHESGAAFMADGYARNSGKLGVCCATTGPGATNLITGVSSAYENQVPMLVISAQTAMKNQGKRAFQESTDTGINIVGMFQFCTHYNSLVTHVEQLEQKLVTAIMTAFSTPGPVHLSFPIDILRTALDQEVPKYDLRKTMQAPVWQDDLSLKQLCEEVRQAQKPVFVLGGGAIEAANQIIDVAVALNAPVVTTPDGKGLISPYHPLCRGVIGFAGHDSAKQLLEHDDIDLVIIAGTLMGEWTSNAWDADALMNERLVHIDSVESNLTLTPMARLHVRGNIHSVFVQLSHFIHNELKPILRTKIDEGVRQSIKDEEGDQGNIEQVRHFELDDLRKFYDESTPIKPQWLMHKLAQLLPPSTRYLADTGNSIAWAIHYLHPFDRRIAERRSFSRQSNGRRHYNAGLFQCALEFAAMGWALGNAIGVALACPDEPVVCITGDGSVLMNGQEITVAQQNGLSVIFIVLNDSSLGMVRHGQRLNKAELIGAELPSVNYAELAKAMGINSYRVESSKDLRDINFAAVCKEPAPTLIDVVVDAMEIPPMSTRMRVLADKA